MMLAVHGCRPLPACGCCRGLHARAPSLPTAPPPLACSGYPHTQAGQDAAAERGPVEPQRQHHGHRRPRRLGAGERQQQRRSADGWRDCCQGLLLPCCCRCSPGRLAGVVMLSPSPARRSSTLQVFREAAPGEEGMPAFSVADVAAAAGVPSFDFVKVDIEGGPKGGVEWWMCVVEGASYGFLPAPLRRLQLPTTCKPAGPVQPAAAAAQLLRSRLLARAPPKHARSQAPRAWCLGRGRTCRGSRRPRWCRWRST